MKHMRDGRMILDESDTAALSSDTRAIIEANNPETGDWDSDYVSGTSMTLNEAREYLSELRNDPEWNGWMLRIVVEIDNCYCGIIS